MNKREITNLYKQYCMRWDYNYNPDDDPYFICFDSKEGISLLINHRLYAFGTTLHSLEHFNEVGKETFLQEFKETLDLIEALQDYATTQQALAEVVGEYIEEGLSSEEYEDGTNNLNLN